MSRAASNDAWREAVEENRDTLEKIAENGKTQLAEDIRQLLEEVDAE